MRYKKLMGIKVEVRVLLTRTPLQNNLTKLISLLGFILPRKFAQHKESIKTIFNYYAKIADHSALLSAQRIKCAHSRIAPFILRREKTQVLSLPKKTCRNEFCDVHPSQEAIYNSILARGKKCGDMGAGAGGYPSKLVDLRKAASHSLLFRRLV